MASYKINNAPPLSNLNDFRAILGRNVNFAKSARFAVQIGRISSMFQELIFMCEAAELPGRAFNTQDYRYYGPTFRLPNQSVYTDINFSFYVNDSMKEKELFDNWMAYINPKNTYNFRYRNEYSTDINIYQYSEVAQQETVPYDNRGLNPIPGGDQRINPNDGIPKATYKATLRQAYPINVQTMPLSWAEDNIHRLQVTFAYTDWVTVPESIERANRPSSLTPFANLNN